MLNLKVQGAKTKRSIGLARHGVLAHVLAGAVVLGGGVTLAGPAFAQGPRTVAPLVKTLAPAVVNISTSQKIKSARGRPLPSVPKGSPFEDLFKDFFDNKKGVGPRRKVASLGSGFVIDGVEGLVVTNNHVIDGADEIEIIFSNGRRLKVEKVLGVDKKTDLALLKVKPDKPLPAVNWGASETIEVGDWVLAIGNPFGLGGSVSMGIISAKQRDIKTGPYDDYLQTDAAINKGNSGGPLFNMDGDVIGVNTAIISPTGGSIGIGFAVPSDVARIVIDQLKKYGETRRGWLGVRVQTVTEDLAASLKVGANEGAFVAAVTDDGPAKKAGLKPGDIIVRFNGKPVAKMRTLLRLVAQADVGQSAPVEIIRDGKLQTVSVVVGLLNEKTDTAEKSDDNNGEQERNGADNAYADGPIAGMSLEPTSPALLQKFGLPAAAKGLVVTEVASDSPAQARGVAPGDLLTGVGTSAIANRDELVKALTAAKTSGRRRVRLVVMGKDGRPKYVAMRL